MESRQRLRELLFLSATELGKLLGPREASEYQSDLIIECLREGAAVDRTALYEEHHVHDEPEGVQ